MYREVNPKLNAMRQAFEEIREIDEAADKIKYVQEIGALGGTLTLEYNAGEITLTGDELIQAAADYDLSEPFEIVPDEVLPVELQEPIEDATPKPLGCIPKIAAMSIPLALFALVGLSFL